MRALMPSEVKDVTDSLLALVPTYGIWLILFSVFLSSLAVPVPASILVMTAGGFVAAGQINLLQLGIVTVLGVFFGDQVAYWTARLGGTRFVVWMARRKRLANSFDRAQKMMDKIGAVSIFLSQTIFSPLGPYMAYVSGILRYNWSLFTMIRMFSNLIWTSGYIALGYYFSAQISEIAGLLARSMSAMVLFALATVILLYIYKNYRVYLARA